MRCVFANAFTAFALPSPQSGAPCGLPVMRPSSTSKRVQRTFSMPKNFAAGSTWNGVADEARISVWPFLRCAAMRRFISGNTRSAMRALKSFSPSIISSRSLRPRQFAAVNAIRSLKPARPRMPRVASEARPKNSPALTWPRMIRIWAMSSAE